MTTEQTILAAILNSRECYEQFARHGDTESLSGLGRLIFKACGEFYRIDGTVQQCDRDIIRQRITRELPNPKHAAAFASYLRDISADASAANIAAEIVAIKRERIAGELSLALANRGSSDAISSLIEQYRSVSVGYSDSSGNTQSELIDVLDTEDLLADKPAENYIKLWPKQLNDRLDGGALRGHHVLVFARGETGKTLFSINLAVGFLHQQLNVLYFCNEEPGADIRDRIRGRLLKVSKSEIRSDRAGSAERIAKRIAKASLGSIYIAEGVTFAGLRSAITGRKTDVVIIDQIRNMKLRSESRTAELEAAGIEARSIAKEFNVLVVSITQAGDSATNKVYLTMSDVDSSKTGLPACADLMLGLGADESMKVNNLIGVSLCKNKLSGLHDKFTCTVDYSKGIIE
jgi:archaellum biogenesis ATPase FlaH